LGKLPFLEKLGKLAGGLGASSGHSRSRTEPYTEAKPPKLIFSIFMTFEVHKTAIKTIFQRYIIISIFCF
jgi:hypothetical protein